MPAGRQGFTLIEVLVILGISAMLLVSVGGVMTSSFKAKNSSEISEDIQNQAQEIMTLLKKNVLDADVDGFTCPATAGSSISFKTKSGGQTTLQCDEGLGKIASVSAVSGIVTGSFNLINNGVSVRNCSGFVTCVLVDQKVATVNFSLDIGITGGSSGNKFWTFVSKVVPR